MEHAAAAGQYPPGLAVEGLAIEIARQAHAGRIVDDDAEMPIREFGDFFAAVAADAADGGVMEQLLRPGVGPGHFLGPRVELDGNHRGGAFCRGDGRVAEPGGGVEHAAADRRRGPDHLQRRPAR